jgi:hypothetical protein
MFSFFPFCIHPIISWTNCQACRLELVAFFFLLQIRIILNLQLQVEIFFLADPLFAQVEVHTQALIESPDQLTDPRSNPHPRGF